MAAEFRKLVIRTICLLEEHFSSQRGNSGREVCLGGGAQKHPSEMRTVQTSACSVHCFTYL
jgi:hypothetical protein